MQKTVPLIALLLVSLAIAGCVQSQPPSTSPPPATNPPSLSVPAQAVTGGTVTIDSVYLDQPGYVVIHKVTSQGTPGVVIGHSELLTGSQRNLSIPISGDGKNQPQLIAMLHYDNGLGYYTNETVDPPVTINGAVVLQKFNNTAYAPPVTTGTLSVTITDPNGNILANAAVDVFVGNQKVATGQTDSQGIATIDNLPVGEVYVTASDSANAYQGASGTVAITADQAATLSIQLLPPLPAPNPGPPTATAMTVTADDSGFYQNGAMTSSLSVPMGTTVNLTVAVNSTNVAHGGLDFKSSAFPTFNVPLGQQKTVSFTVNSAVQIDSYWPSTSIHKATLTISPQ